MEQTANSIRRELRAARQTWCDIGAPPLRDLRSLLVRYKFSVILGEITRIDSRWYVTHSGLLRLASRRKCRGIKTFAQQRLCNPAANRWVFRAVVYIGPKLKCFVGYGDADPTNTSSLVRGAEMRVAETRAVNRALRKAYGIGLCSVEELGRPPASIPPLRGGKAVHPPNGNGSANGQPRLRDKLCLVIRKHQLDPNLVKRYAADFCGTETLRDAGRDMVAAFVSTVAEEAAKDRAALICKLNSYSQPEEVKS
jgi:hypothetical protein